MAEMLWHLVSNFLAHQIEYSAFFARFNKAYPVHMHKIKLVDLWPCGSDKNVSSTFFKALVVKGVKLLGS